MDDTEKELMELVRRITAALERQADFFERLTWVGKQKIYKRPVPGQKKRHWWNW